MGSELSCPCGTRQDIEQDAPKESNKDIIEEVMKGKLSKDQLLYEYTTSSDTMSSKICLVSTSNLDAFFAYINLLVIENKYEINLYYNTIFISNFLVQEDLACIILQYKKGQEDRTTYYIKPTSNSKRSLKNDYSAVYKVESINFVSNDNEKIQEQILNDLYSQLKKGYRFYGIITDNPEIINKGDFSKSFAVTSKTPKIRKNYKILYKKSKLTDNLDIKYSVVIYENNLTTDSITKVLTENKDKTLKSVIKEHNFEGKFPYSYFFIFEGNKITPEYDESEFLVVKIEKDKSTPDSFLKDIAEKINLQEGATLLSVINERNGFFLIFKYDITAMDDD